jgi:hypothetical protein
MNCMMASGPMMRIVFCLDCRQVVSERVLDIHARG